MKLTNNLLKSRPENIKPDANFTDDVMAKVASKNTKSKVWRMLTLRPVLTLVAAVVAVSIVSGASYAVASLLWPDISVTVNDNGADARTNRQQLAVYADNCGSEDLSRRFEVKSGHTMTEDEFKRTVQADCEHREMYQWALGHFGQHITSLGDPSPGYEYSTTRVSPGSPAEILQTDDGKLTLNDESNHDIPASAMVVIGRQQATYADLRSGDVVSVIIKSNTDYRNMDNCNNEHCSSEIVSQKDEIVAVVKLDFTLQDYDRIAQLIRTETCMGNENDICHEGLGGMEVFTRKFEADSIPIEEGNNARIEGKIQSITPSELVIQTSSGREITLKTAIDITSQYNQSQSAIGNNTYMSEGDSIAIWYRLNGDQSAQIDLADVFDITLLLEIANRVDPLVKY